MSITVFPVAKQVVRPAWFDDAMGALEHASSLTEPVYETDYSKVSQNIIFKMLEATATSTDETLQTLSDLSFPISSREMWAFDCCLEFGTTSSGQALELALVIPTGVQVYAFVLVPLDDNDAPGNLGIQKIAGTGSTESAVMTLANSVLAEMPARIVGVAIGQSAGGTIDVQFSKGNAAAGQVRVFLNSFLVARRILH